MGQSDLNREKLAVQRHWDATPCGAGSTAHPVGTLEFFEAQEQERYRRFPFIHSFAQFPRWHRKRVLEVGVGVGADFLQFSRAGAQAVGLDLSPRSVELAKEQLDLYGLHAHLIVGDGENLPFPSDRFDLVYSWGVIHHSPTPQRVIQEVYRVLRPGGMVKAMMYHSWSLLYLRVYADCALLTARPFARIGRLLADCQESPGTKAFRVAELRRMFRQFSDLKLQMQPSYLDRQMVRKLFPFARWLDRLIPDGLASWVLIEGKKPGGPGWP